VKKRHEKERAEKAGKTRAAKEQTQRDQEATTAQKLSQQANKPKRKVSHKAPAEKQKSVVLWPLVVVRARHPQHLNHHPNRPKVAAQSSFHPSIDSKN
jgi:hypothetical protein